MATGILGRKVGMMQWFDDEGRAVGATVVEAEPNVVVQVKDSDNDGYEALQIGFAEVEAKKVNKPKHGHFERAGVAPRRHLREFPADADADHEVGEEIGVDAFEVGERIDVSGLTKGKGFQGGMKRHGFHGAAASHGEGKRSPRRPGSIGNIMATGKVFKGKKMAGRMGQRRATVQKLEVLKVDPEKNVIVLKGGVPGPRGAVLELCKRDG
ncbi:MAG: 50S ribosomal protein L3 [Candidatus Bipolaricaulia bacterium]